MLRHQISEIIRETITANRNGVTKRSCMEAADQIIELIRDEMELRAEYSKACRIVDVARAHLSLPE